ncbi:amino acid permease [Miniphocaeibacter massiliensis]|uniref:amino acid permease n=1 Tax=Miniphocaeibacter massiliensis TaxID=2041841 RepID=UPI000C078ECA|nr:amino acid permease [Miniphocaeibacter massiliensis]
MENLKATLSMRQGIGILVSTLLGSGIFIVPAMIASEVGILSIFCWILIIILMIPIAITFGDLGAKYPNASGAAFFVESAFGKGIGKAISFFIFVCYSYWSTCCYYYWC